METIYDGLLRRYSPTTDRMKMYRVVRIFDPSFDVPVRCPGDIRMIPFVKKGGMPVLQSIIREWPKYYRRSRACSETPDNLSDWFEEQSP